MRITESKLRQIIRRELQLEFFGMFSGDPEWLESNGEINRNKLSDDQRKIYAAASKVGNKGGEHSEAKKAVEAVGFPASGWSKDDEALIRKSYEKAKVSYTSGQMA